MIRVAWILQLCLLSGSVMKEQTCVSTQNNITPPTIQSVIELRKGTTGRHNFQPHFSSAKLQPAGLSSSLPFAAVNPGSPLPRLCDDILS